MIVRDDSVKRENVLRYGIEDKEIACKEWVFIGKLTKETGLLPKTARSWDHFLSNSLVIGEPCNDWLNILNLYDICKNKNGTPYGAAHKRFRHTRARFIWECWYRTAPSIQATPEPPPEVRQAPCQGSKPPLPFRRIATPMTDRGRKGKKFQHILYIVQILPKAPR